MNTEDIKIMAKTILPRKPIKPRIVLNSVLGLAVGFLFSLGMAFLIEYLDNTLKTDNDIEKHLGMTVLVTMPYVQ